MGGGSLGGRCRALVGLGALGLATIAWGAHAWWSRPQCEDVVRVTWVSGSANPLGAQLEPGDYTLEIAADARQTRCRVHVRSTAKHTDENEVACTDDSVRFWRRAGQFTAFDVRGLPAVLEVRLVRDGGAPWLRETVRPTYPPTPIGGSGRCVPKDIVLAFAEGAP